MEKPKKPDPLKELEEALRKAAIVIGGNQVQQPKPPRVTLGVRG
jgi:hypothetical protein